MVTVRKYTLKIVKSIALLGQGHEEDKPIALKDFAGLCVRQRLFSFASRKFWESFNSVDAIKQN